MSIDAKAIYKKAIVVDGLNICNFSEEIFKQWNAGGISAVSATCGLWEGIRDSLDNIIMWRHWFEDFSQLIVQAKSVDDIRKAKIEGKTAVILSWQNTSGIEDRLDYLSIFSDLGIKIMQLTYNTQNYSGSGYTETNDSGLSDFGLEVINEMSRVGIVCDLSHVGNNTSADVIEKSPKAPCFTHIQPEGLKKSKRNKPDYLIKAVAERGGMIGLSEFGPAMIHGNDSTIDDYIGSIEYVMNITGEEHVGIGSDASQGHGRPSPFMEWCNRDKGYARMLTAFNNEKVVKPLGPLAERAIIAEAMAKAGWGERLMLKVLGENWLNYLDTIWNK